jgi:DNA-binding response OmpR family regulator
MTSVMVVEDDQMFAKAVGRDLSEQGFAVTVLHSVSAALEVLTGGRIDVLLTDLRLGTEDGIDLLESLSQVSPSTRAVLMSGFATARDYQRAMELGAVRVLCKPFNPTELIQCIRQAVECETGFRGSVHGLSLVDMLQMFNYGRRSVSIAVAGQNPGRLHLRDGQIVHVEHQGRVGESALISLLAMPGGTLSTSALMASVDQTVSRDFREALFDALRSIDEASGLAASSVGDLDVALALDDLAPPTTEVMSPHALVLERIRAIEGYVAACVVLSDNGGVLSYDGRLDLRPAAPLSAEVIRQSQKLIVDLGLDDQTEDVLFTDTSQFHLLRSLQSEVPAFVHLVLDRSQTTPVMAKLALASAVRSRDL